MKLCENNQTTEQTDHQKKQKATLKVARQTHLKTIASDVKDMVDANSTVELFQLSISQLCPFVVQGLSDE